MLFLGDIHADIKLFPRSVRNVCIQVGDFGFGFGAERWILPEFWRFIRGNHDDPKLCWKSDNYLGDYGYFDESNDLFFVSGARSADQALRTIGVDWWHNEELSVDQLTQMLENYSGAKIVVTHECPISISELLYPNQRIERTRTGQALQLMLEYMPPNIWIFGHHHRSFRTQLGNTLFVGLGIGETFEVD